MKVGVIINPIAGRGGSRPGEGERRRAFVEAQTAAAGVWADVRMTERQGHARELAQACLDLGCGVVIAMGGDGTVNEVAQALIGGPVPLGIVPCGSGNGLARGLGLPTNLRAAMRVALTGTATSIDAGYANDRLFLNIAGIGFDAAVVQLCATRGKRGALGYVTKSLQLVWTYRAPSYDVVCGTQRRDTRRWTGPKFLIGFANAPEYGNGAVLSPDADVRDGLLDMVLVEAGGPLQQCWRARRLFWNRRAPARGLERVRVDHARITGDRIVCHLDGEVFEMSGTLVISVRPLAIRVVRAWK